MKQPLQLQIGPSTNTRVEPSSSPGGSASSAGAAASQGPLDLFDLWALSALERVKARWYAGSLMARVALYGLNRAGWWSSLLGGEHSDAWV